MTVLESILREYEVDLDLDKFKRQFAGHSYNNNDLCELHYSYATRIGMGESQLTPLFNYLNTITPVTEDNVYITEGMTYIHD